MIKQTGAALAEARDGGIPISALNPDADGDGKVQPWEELVYQKMIDADADKSGVISVKELYAVIHGSAESDRLRKVWRKAALVASLLIILLIAAIGAMTVGVVAGFKDMYAEDSQ